MSPLITPPIRQTHIPFALHRPPAAPIQGLITPNASRIALDLSTIVVVRDEAAPIVVVDLVVEFVAAHAVEERRWRQLGEERGEVGQGEGRGGVCRERYAREGHCWFGFYFCFCFISVVVDEDV
jgi:hypothetical protein